MKYLEEYLNIKLKYGKQVNDFPNYINARYRIRKVQLNEVDAVFVYPLYDLENIEALKKHIASIQRKYSCPIILCLKHLTSRQKQCLLREQIPFIVEDKQIYLPFMAIYLQERNDPEKVERKSMLPSAQMVLLYFIQHHAQPINTSILVKELGLTSTSIQRAVEQLLGYGLIQIKKEGVQKKIFSESTPKELYESAQQYLLNPVKRTVYADAGPIKGLLFSGYSALSEYSMLNPADIQYYAANHIHEVKDISDHLQSTEHQAAIQIWRYDPKKLSNTNTVDPLSLALSFKDEEDERVEEAVEEMLEEYWRRLNGKGN